MKHCIFILGCLLFLLSACTSESTTPQPTSTPTITAASIQTPETPGATQQILCTQQPPINIKNFSPIYSEIDLDSRIEGYKDTLEVSFRLLYISYIEFLESNKDAKIFLLVFFINRSTKDIVVRIPPKASNEITAFGLAVDLKDLNGNKFYNLDFGVGDLYLPSISDYIKIPPGKSHCVQYDINWIVSETGLVGTMESGDPIYVGNFVPPGTYLLRINYTNYNYKVIYEEEDFDINPWVGNILSDWIEVKLP